MSSALDLPELARRHESLSILVPPCKAQNP